MSYSKRQLPKCMRCHEPGAFVWLAISGPARRVLPEIVLCPDCLYAMKSTLVSIGGDGAVSTGGDSGAVSPSRDGAGGLRTFVEV
jgi:hypothetical protein